MRIITFVAASTLTPDARAALDFCIAARSAGHEAILAGLVRSRGTPGLTELGAAADAARVPFRLLQQRYKFDPGLIGQMEMMFRRLKPDLFMSHDYPGAAVARMARYRPGCVAHFAHGEEPGARSIERRWFGRGMLRLCDVIVVDSEERAGELAARGLKPSRFVRATPSGEWTGEVLRRAITGVSAA